jgi:copper homeostasis protein (lipoprotein)
LLLEVKGGPPLTEGREAPYLLLNADGRYSGTAGCNRIMGAYEASGEALTFSAGARTMMMCEETLMRQEEALLRALGATAPCRITGETMELIDSDGEVVARFHAGDTP